MTLDRIVKDDDECNIMLCKNVDSDIRRLVSFLIRAKKVLIPSAKIKCRPHELIPVISVMRKIPISIMILIWEENNSAEKKLSGSEAVPFGV